MKTQKYVLVKFWHENTLSPGKKETLVEDFDMEDVINELSAYCNAYHSYCDDNMIAEFKSSDYDFDYYFYEGPGIYRLSCSPFEKIWSPGDSSCDFGDFTIKILRRNEKN